MTFVVFAVIVFWTILNLGSNQAFAAFPLNVTDDTGRTITFTQPARRIVSLVPSHTEILFALQAGEQVVGVDDYSDWPVAAAQKPKVGSLTGVNYEMLLGLETDLVLGMAAHKDQGVVEKLEDLHIPVLILEPQSLQQTYDTIKVLGQVTGHESQAQRIVASMKETVDWVVRKTQAQPSRRVFYEVWNDPLMTAGPGSFIHQLITLANGENIAADTKEPWPMFSLETILARDPEVIITPFAETAAALKNGERPEWNGITAVKSRRVYHIDPNIISRPGPRLAEGLKELARRIHPEVFDDNETE